jgi:Na+/phosphate symporter
MILVRTNSKIAIALVAVSLLISAFVVWHVTRTTDKVADQGIALQKQAADMTQQAMKAANDATTNGTPTTEQLNKTASDIAKQADAATNQALETAKNQGGVPDSAKKQIQAAEQQLAAAQQ